MKRRALPPTRLSWPGDESLTSFSEESLIVTNDFESSSSLTNKKSSSVSVHHRPKRKGIQSYEVDSPNDNSLMWTEKHAPTKVCELCVQPKKIQEVREWMIQSYSSIQDQNSKLLVLTGGPGIGKSTMCKVLAKELGINIVQWNDSQNVVTSNIGYTQSQLSSFSEFLNSASSFQSLPCLSSSSYMNQNLLLIENLPNLHSEESEIQLRAVMTEFLSRAFYPAIFIFSDTNEGKVNSSHLEKLIEPTLLYSQKVKIVHINPTTKAKLKRACERVAKRERSQIPESFKQEIDLSTNGDIRSATLALQFILVGKKRQKSTGESNILARDNKLSPFHVLGKILYAKREPHPSQIRNIGKTLMIYDVLPPLSFNPEETLTKCDLSIDRCIEFLGYHSPSFFTNETELSTALTLFSDTAMLLDKRFDAGNDSSERNFPFEYANSLAGRAVAYANRNPAPNSFRTFCAPKVFEVRRKQRDNIQKIKNIRMHLSYHGMLSHSSAYHFSHGDFLIDLSYLSIILPNGKSAKRFI